NMICYPNPYPKLYSILPPHRDDLDEMLAIVFTGVARPTDEDKRRIPFLVRRNRVRTALNWLKLNNVLYKDILISEKNIQSYTDNVIPSVITYAVDDTNNPLESRAVHDADDAIGSENDQECLFSVNGLAYDVLDPDNLEAVKAAALKHMMAGRALAIPHEPSPDTLWHNPDLFPNMFPWLFPYGVGGIANSTILGEMSEHSHKKHLMMYHDK
ncbi:hypothetical protein EXIGLDRAFT_584959, partial [Exidia glandulosa HHB12029]